MIGSETMNQDDAERTAAQLNNQLEMDRFGKRFIAVSVDDLPDEVDRNGFVVILEK